MNSFAKLLKAMFKGWTWNRRKKIHCKRREQSKINQVLKSPKSVHNPKWMNFIVNSSKCPLTKEDYLSLEWVKRVCSKTKKKTKKQTNKRKEQRKWNDPITILLILQIPEMAIKWKWGKKCHVSTKQTKQARWSKKCSVTTKRTKQMRWVPKQIQTRS